MNQERSSMAPRTRAERRDHAGGADQSPTHIDTARAAAEREPRLPHERDEALGMTSQQPDAKLRRAHDDVAQGRQDTDRGPVADRVYRRLKRGG